MHILSIHVPGNIWVLLEQHFDHYGFGLFVLLYCSYFIGYFGAMAGARSCRDEFTDRKLTHSRCLKRFFAVVVVAARLTVLMAPLLLKLIIYYYACNSVCMCVQQLPFVWLSYLMLFDGLPCHTRALDIAIYVSNQAVLNNKAIWRWLWWECGFHKCIKWFKGEIARQWRNVWRNANTQELI